MVVVVVGIAAMVVVEIVVVVRVGVAVAVAIVVGIAVRVGVRVGVGINFLRRIMKRIVESTSNEGLEALLGENVTLFCTRYIYYGKLVGLNTNFCLLENPQIVYETGAWDKNEWADAQKLPKNEWYVMLHSIESFGLAK